MGNRFERCLNSWPILPRDVGEVVEIETQNLKPRVIFSLSFHEGYVGLGFARKIHPEAKRKKEERVESGKTIRTILGTE